MLPDELESEPLPFSTHSADSNSELQGLEEEADVLFHFAPSTRAQKVQRSPERASLVHAVIISSQRCGFLFSLADTFARTRRAEKTLEEARLKLPLH
ncbi:hypothetical protein AAFF_G00243980 [Aldrovandia affinis]|uniref:Uncharacterized protein n=1 Tax=Aldrovandia affinis TaxID=143900 RepID=A0AAD7W3H5_9TELE|nr:hypothetical protein AAFF_G00243980 [Aldrovandia affinis]